MYAPPPGGGGGGNGNGGGNLGSGGSGGGYGGSGGYGGGGSYGGSGGYHGGIPSPHVAGCTQCAVLMNVAIDFPPAWMGGGEVDATGSFGDDLGEGEGASVDPYEVPEASDVTSVDSTNVLSELQTEVTDEELLKQLEQQMVEQKYTNATDTQVSEPNSDSTTTSTDSNSSASAHAGETKYYFRGTSKGFPGSTGVQRLGVTPVSTNPAIATTFATGAEQFGEGVVYIATPEDLTGVEVGPGDYLAELESSASVWTTPSEFAERASIALDAADARGILRSMGVSIPGSIGSYDQLSATLRDTSVLSPDQIESFVQLAGNW
jgi:hypothetical protein